MSNIKKKLGWPHKSYKMRNENVDSLLVKSLFESAIEKVDKFNPRGVKKI